jgi:DnaD/phage-associated family protein
MEYFVNTGQWGSLFAVPVSVVDEYIKLAGGHSLKVLLYVLRNGNRIVSRDEIASALNIDHESIDDAFNFWESVGIFSQNENTSHSMKKATIPSVFPSEKTETSIQKSAVQDNRPERAVYEKSSERFVLRPSEIAERIRSSEQIRNLFTMAESSLGRMLNNIEQSSLVWIHEYLGLNIDVILMLVQYLSSVGKGNMAYIEKVAFDWRDKNINTLREAQNEIQRIQQFSSYENKILALLGINTHPSSNQHEIMNEWYDKGISTELVECAYDRTMDSIGKMSFPYMNSIIMTWHEKKITNLAGVKEYEKNNPPPKRTFGRNGQKNTKEKKRSYNIAEFEKFAINYNELKEIGEENG